mgnify:CR=1 FL=1
MHLEYVKEYFRSITSIHTLRKLEKMCTYFNNDQNNYIKILFHASRILNLFLLRITKNGDNYVFSKISTCKAFFSLVFHIILNLSYVTSTYFMLPAEFRTIKFSGCLFIFVYSLCHITAISISIFNSKRIYSLMFNTHGFKTVPLLNTQELFKESAVFLIIFSSIVCQFLNEIFYNFNDILSFGTWYIMNISAYIVAVHFITIINNLKITVEKINTKFSNMQISSSAVRRKFYNLKFTSNTEHKSYPREQKSTITEIKSLSNSYFKVCNSTVEIGDIFSILLLLIAAKTFIVVTFHCFVMVINTRSSRIQP